MALAIKLERLSSQLLSRSRIYLCNATRYYSDDRPEAWNSLWRPGKYSKKDHDKIAEKYHLHPKEYQPYPEDENRFLGDYPKLPQIGEIAKDPFYPYDVPAFRKNYQETIHTDYEIMTEERIPYGIKPRYDLGLIGGGLIFFGIMGGAYLIYVLVEPYPTIRIWSEKQYPKEGVVHYTFEPAK